MRFVCDSCRAQYMISDEKVGPKGVKVRCKKCGYVILVKKADASQAKAPPAPQPPVPLSNDPDDALATQVMQNPLGGPPTAPFQALGDEGDSTHPGINEEKTGQMPAQGSGLLDASEDEIGAVFDQVLNSGAHSIPKAAKEDQTELDRPAIGDEPDDRLSTRVIDPDTVKKLAEEAGGSDASNAEAKNGNGHAPAKEVPRTDWFVAIDDKQTGPLTLEKLKEHWEAGEIGPDSLCWRAGFSDWVPVSEVADLAAELAPRPAKPVMVAPVTVGSMPPGAVVSVPVESAFSAGGVMKSVRSEVQVPLAAAGPEETGSWRPSAASALASLVKDEMDALAKPAVRPPDASAPPEVSTGGLLSDLPEASVSVPKAKGVNGHNGARAEPPAAGEMTAAHGPRNPYIASPGATYSSPAVTQYRPPSENNKIALYAILAFTLVAVLSIGAFVLVNLNKSPAPAPVAQVQPPAPPQPPPTTPPPAPGNAAPAPGTAVGATPAPGSAPAPGAATPAPGTAPSGTTAAAPAAAAPAPAATTASAAGGTPSKPAPTKPTAPPKKDTLVASKEPEKAAEKPKEEKPSKAVVEPKGDDFDNVFGTGSSKPKKEEAPKEKAAEESGTKKKTVFVPEAPGGGGNIPETLGQSDVMEVVKGNVPAIKKCVDEQKAKDPASKGRMVMRWQILTTGKVSKVECTSDEFKGSPLAGCLGALIKTWQFPKHKTQGEPISFPFTF